MNQEWSVLNKKFQVAINKKESFNQGIIDLIELRSIMMKEIISFKEQLSFESFSLAPLIKTIGYQNKTIAYSLYHIFRIEDIVCNLLIGKKTDIFQSKGYQQNMNSSIKTTGNELSLEEVVLFSQKINMEMLYNYIEDVYLSTNHYFKNLSFDDLKLSFSNDDVNRLKENQVVASSEKSNWLIQYWCSKDVKGLLKMPFSRHWIMHVEAAIRIMKKLTAK